MIIYKSVNKGSRDRRNLTAKLKNKETCIISQVHEFILKWIVKSYSYVHFLFREEKKSISIKKYENSWIEVFSRTSYSYVSV